MVATFWLNAVADYSQVLSVSPEGVLLLLAIAFSIFIGTFLAITTKNKNAGLFGFFGMYSICGLIGLVDWIFIAVPLISIAFVYFYFQKEGES